MSPAVSCVKRSKIRSRSAGGTPGPSSRTAMRARSPQIPMVSSVAPAPWRSELARRLTTTRSSRFGSAQARTGSSGACRTRARPAAVNATVKRSPRSIVNAARSTRRARSRSVPASRRVRSNSSSSKVRSRSALRFATERSPSGTSSAPSTSVSGVRSSWVRSAMNFVFRSSSSDRRAAWAATVSFRARRAAVFWFRALFCRANAAVWRATSASSASPRRRTARLRAANPPASRASTALPEASGKNARSVRAGVRVKVAAATGAQSPRSRASTSRRERPGGNAWSSSRGPVALHGRSSSR